MRMILILALIVLAGCASTPRVEPLKVSYDDILELPVRPQPPAPETATQRSVAGFIIDLGAYTDVLESKLLALKEALNGSTSSTPAD